jgi:hypothetical protein
MSWLTRFLGYDFTIGRLESQVQDYRDLVRTKDEIFSSMLDIKDQEIRRLTDLMLVEHGVIRPESDEPRKPIEKPQPIGKRQSWGSVQKRFEAADAKFAQEAAREQVDKVRDYWLKKDAVKES